MRRRTILAALAALTVAVSVLPQSGTAAKAPTPAPKPAPKSLFADLYPPAPFAIVVKQPDGSTFRGTLQPGEVGGNLETVDGNHAVVKDQSSGWWYYAASAEGSKLMPSPARVGIDPVPARTPEGLGRIPSIWDGQMGRWRDETLRVLQVASYNAQMQAAETGQLPYVFHTPFLLVATWYDKEAGQTSPQFQEGHDVEFFTKMLDGFGGNATGTMTEFWLENSYGQFLVDVDVFGPYTSYRSLNDPCYYGNVEPETQEVAGQELSAPLVGSVPRVDDGDPAGNALGIGGIGAVGMAIEAVPQSDPEIDYGKYDNDNDGKVDFVGLIHSGADMAATGDPCHTWSHAFEVTFASSLIPAPLGPLLTERGGMPTSDVNAEGEPVVVDRVFTMPEIGGNIGVAVHEMMHARGEPDYYNTGYSSAGTGDWDIMAGGSWFGNPPGTNPLGANPVTRVFQGWVTPKVVSSDLRGVKLAPREIMPMKNYDVTKVDPNIVLVPVEWTDSTEPADVYGLPKDPKNGKYITQGWYIEYISRSVTAPPMHPEMNRSPYFDRFAYSTGVMVWHFDYHKKSNVYYGANNGQSDPNRSQLDVEEFDFLDNTQELQLNYSRGEPSDLFFGTATGMTTGTRRNPPGIPTGGTPQAAVTGGGVLAPFTEADYPFTVDANPANYEMKAELNNFGDCTLALLYKEKNGELRQVASIDSAGAGSPETLVVYKPPAGEWVLRVGDFAACTEHDFTVGFGLPFFTMGTADTFTNQGQPTGWAFTNIGPSSFEGMAHAAEGAGPDVISLDIVNIGKTESDVSAGFVRGTPTKTNGSAPMNAGRAGRIVVPVYNNGGKALRAVDVALREGAPDGPLVGSTTVTLGGYANADVPFMWTPSREGQIDLFATVDPTEEIAELLETNNTQKTTITVGPESPVVLIVDDEGSTDNEETYIGALTALGIPWALAKDHADAALMRQYKAVIWEAGLDRYQGQLNADDRREIATYLNGGGTLWYTSTRAASALGSPPSRTNPGATPDMIPFLRDYFGVIANDTIQSGGGVVSGAGDASAIGGKRPIVTDVLPGRPLQDVWDMAAGESASEKGTAARLLSYAKGGDMGVRVTGNAAHKGFKTVFFGFNLRQVVLGQEQVALTREVMKHLGVPMGSYVPQIPLVWHSEQRVRVAGQTSWLTAYAFNVGQPSTMVRAHKTGMYRRIPMKSAGVPGVYNGIIFREYSTPMGIDYYVDSQLNHPSDGPHVTHYVGVGLPVTAPPVRRR